MSTPDLSRKMYEAVWRGRLSSVTDLLKEGASAKEIYANDRSLLHVAGWFNHPDLVAPLCEQGADPQTQDNGGSTPVMLAIQNGSFSSFKALIMAGAQLDQVTSSGTTGLHHLVKFGRQEWMDWMSKQKNPPDWAQARDQEGSTLAHVAARLQNWKILSWLCVRGLSPEIKNIADQSVIDILKPFPAGQRWIKSASGLSKPSSVQRANADRPKTSDSSSAVNATQSAA